MRKSIKIFAAVAMTVALASCGGLGNLGGLGSSSSSSSSSSSTGNILGSILGSATSGETIGNVLGSVLGTNKPSESDIVGTWKYKQPGVAFTSDNALANAGGEAVATQIKSKLQTTYSKIGFKSSNTYLTFNSDKSFSGKLDGTSVSGTWSYDKSDSKLTLKTLLFTVPCYAKKTTSGMSFLMESKKLLSLLQTVSKLTGNSTLETIGDLSKNYDGVRMGFDMNK